MKRALVLGGSGTIGHATCKRLKKEGFWVRSVDIKENEYSRTAADEFLRLDLRNDFNVKMAFSNKEKFDYVFAYMAQMGGGGYVFSKMNDSEIIYDSAIMNLNVAKTASEIGCGTILFSSSACAYSEQLQMTNESNYLKESDAWCGKPDSVYGIEKLFSEQVYDSFRRNKGLNVRICRFHNVYSEEGVYQGGREKAPAAICRKVALAKDGDEIDIWGDGKQVRSFLYVEEALDGVLKLMESNYYFPLNIGSEEAISINDLAKMIISISGKNLSIKNVESDCIGVRGRNSDNTLIKEVLGWSPVQPLRVGIEKLYNWIKQQIYGDF